MVHNILLAGGGHAHALLLSRWLMKPFLKPDGFITFISRESETIYSSMVPGIIAKKYSINDAIINIRFMAEKAGFVFIKSEINGVDLISNTISLLGNRTIDFDVLSLNTGCETTIDSEVEYAKIGIDWMPIKPFSKSLKWINDQDIYDSFNEKPFIVIGSGMAAVEISLALRARWGARRIILKTKKDKISRDIKNILKSKGVDVLTNYFKSDSPKLLCTGNSPPPWILNSNFETDLAGRIITANNLQVLRHRNVFAVGDIAVIEKNYRPASGVWAVRSSLPLAKNLERINKSNSYVNWKPQLRAIQIMSIMSSSFDDCKAIAFWGRYSLGPLRILWIFKDFIDRNFIKKNSFDNPNKYMHINNSNKVMDCRGCASKLASELLRDSLLKSDLYEIANTPEDAVLIYPELNNSRCLQSVDGFPALVSDPWLNGRLTALHAFSDLWATGASLSSAQAVITLPYTDSYQQKELLIETLSGIKSALSEHDVSLLGGHTLESRQLPPVPVSLGIQVSLVINGILGSDQKPWSKSGLKEGDVILLSRELGTGVLFAASMIGKVPIGNIDKMIDSISKSQNNFYNSIMALESKQENNQIVNASTDITGFGLIGHLSEILYTSNALREKNNLRPLSINLEANSIPYYEGSMDLLLEGYHSTLAPSNSKALKILKTLNTQKFFVDINLNNLQTKNISYKSISSLLIDPQTCGPLLISCSRQNAEELVNIAPWHKIGYVV